MFKTRHAIALALLLLAAAAVFVLRRFGVEREILVVVPAAALPIALWVGLGGKCCGRCKRDANNGASATWFAF
jgi:hypothetical protein